MLSILTSFDKKNQIPILLEVATNGLKLLKSYCFSKEVFFLKKL